MKKSNLLPSLILGCICLVAALLLSVVNKFTAPIIEKNRSNKVLGALSEVYPEGKDFKEIDISKYDLPASITAAYSEGSGGFVIQSTVTAYQPGLVILCGIDKDGKIVGADYVESKETLGAEIGLGDRFVGKTQAELTPDIVSGPTAKLTTGAYYQAIHDCLNAFIILNGGSVDFRSPEQIKCNEALGTEDLTFTKWLKLAKLEGISAVYEADSGERVFVVGDKYVGVKNGEVVTADVSDDEKALVLEANTLVASLTALETVEKTAEMKATIKSIKKAANGTYVFELSASGYAVKFAYSVNKTPISILVSIGADGKIIDVVTVSHEESNGIGDVCATEEYYDQYRGKGDEDIVISSGYPTADHGSDLIPEGSTDVGAISSATYTTVGYQTAIKDALAAFKLLNSTEGGND